MALPPIAEASDPVVYQTRALKPIPAEFLVLVPYAEALSPVDVDKPFNRPKPLHPSLQHLAIVTVQATGEEATEYEARSPLTGKGGWWQMSPSPYWTVIEVDPDDGGVSPANMEWLDYQVPVETPMPQVVGGRKKAKTKAYVQALAENIRQCYLLWHITTPPKKIKSYKHDPHTQTMLCVLCSHNLFNTFHLVAIMFCLKKNLIRSPSRSSAIPSR